MMEGDWVIFDVEKAKEEYDYFFTHSYFQGRKIAEGRIVKTDVADSHRGPVIEIPRIAEDHYREHRVRWDLLEPSTCDEHGKKLYHDAEEEWYCPFCSAGDGVKQSKA